ncbi:MAG TPA: PIN domain-containing protein [Phycisphaerae bacterium]|nr:PIN domain-containing protein [Phycisphaerae bacterium]HNU45476.1 PIN domain-containing protein [Phycisphaerae bacterium]
MDGYLLDTNTIRHWFDGDSGKFPAVRAVADSRAADSPMYVSAISLGEIEYGHALNPAPADTRRAAFVTFVREKLRQILSVSKHTAEPYGLIRAELAEKSPPPGGWKNKVRPEQMYDPVAGRELGIDENDLWLAAQAVERNLVLVTSDKMARVREAVQEVFPSFRSENWAASSR